MGKTSFSKRLRFIIEEKNIRQVDLCQKTGIGKSAMSQYLHGSFEPKQQNLHALAKALNVSEAWLMGYDVPRTRKPSEPVFRGNSDVSVRQDANPFFSFTMPDDSMIHAHIPRNAAVVIQRQPPDDISDGQIVCFSLNDRETPYLRFFYRNSDTMLFTPANPDYSPIIRENTDLSNHTLQIYGTARQIVIDL